MEAGDLDAHGWGCAGLGVNGERQRSLLAERRRTPSDHHISALITRRAASQ